MKNLIKYGFAILPLLVLACGDETVVEKTMEDRIGVVPSVAELPKCEKSNDGEQVLVKEESSIRVCSDGKWFAAVGDTAYIQDEGFACYAEKLPDGSGTKILCNGDSVGVVLNGADGADGEGGAEGKIGPRGIRGEQGDDGEPGLQGPEGDSGAVGNVGESGVGCSIKKIDEYTVRIVCATDSTTLCIGDAPVELDSEKVAVSLDEVSGTSQKGPFLSGSKVSAYEVADGRSLKQTGNAFNGKIMNDKGEFQINARMLVSQYLVLEATGFYRNEVTGKNSNSELTLFAITDVTNRNVVNVNLLTHLEYDRVQYLVTRKKMKVRDAKKQAQKELLGMLLIDSENFSNSEDLNIVGSSDEDAALLAFSVLMQGDRSVAELSELLTNIAADVEEDGIWNDIQTKFSIAKWAADADNAGLLDSIRSHVQNWGLSAKVPDFEKYVRHFWYTEYGLDSCTRSGEVKMAIDAANTHYVCKGLEDSSEKYQWVIATDEEKDTYLWEPEVDGEIKSGDVTNASYVFDGVQGKWRKMNEMESVLGVCIESVESDASKNTGRTLEGDWRKCENRAWVETTALFVDTQAWIAGNDGEVKKGDSTDAYYVYDEGELAWREANEYDYTLGLNGCTKNRVGEMKQSAADNEYYSCTLGHLWTSVSVKEVENTEGYVCEEGIMVRGKVDAGTYFVCDAGVWREATEEEEQAGEACTAGLEGHFNGDSTRICENKRFRYTIFYDFPVEKDWTNPLVPYDTLVDERDGHIYRIVEMNGITVMAENLNYAGKKGDSYLVDNNWCYKGDTINCLKGGRYYTWTAAMNIDPKWQSASVDEVEGLIDSPHQGICPSGWHVPTVDEWFALIKGFDAKDLYALGWPSVSIGANATNASGLSILPTGRHIAQGWAYEDWDDFGENDYWYVYIWTASSGEYRIKYEDGSLGWMTWSFDYGAFYVNTDPSIPGDDYKRNAFPVRCIKDSE